MVYVVHECSTMRPAKDPAIREGNRAKTHCLLFISSGEGMGRYRYSVYGSREVEVNDRVQVGRKSVMDVFSC
jgi:hypothetical protein